MGELIVELLLRLVKVGAAALIGALIYAVGSGVEPTAAGVTLAVASFVAGAGVILLLESSPL